MQPHTTSFLVDSQSAESPTQHIASSHSSLTDSPPNQGVDIDFAEGDQFPTLSFSKAISGASSTLRLDPFLRREELQNISRIAISPDMSRIAIIAREKKSDEQALLIIHRRENSARRIDHTAYDIRWLNDDALLFTSLLNVKPHALFAVHTDNAPTLIYTAANPAQEVLFAPHHIPDQAFIEVRSPTASSIFSLSSSQPVTLLPILTDDLPGATCTRWSGRYACLSYKHHAFGEVRTVNETGSKIITQGSSNQPLVSLDSDRKYLRVFFSTGTATGLQLVSDDLQTVKRIAPLGPVTTLLPAQHPRSRDDPRIKVRSFLEPTRTISTEQLLHVDSQADLRLLDAKSGDAGHAQEQALLIPSNDSSVSIPVSLVLPNKARGLLVRAYGAYGIPLHAEHSEKVDSLLAQGIALAIVHVRGGGELGPAWHKAGSGSRKLQAVQDLLIAIRQLQNYLGISPQQTILHGRSAGGWLAAKAVITDSNVCSGVILEAPLLNLTEATSALNAPLYHRDRTEWGAPHTARLLSATPISSQLSLPLDILITIPSKDELIPPRETLSWAMQARCRQPPGYAMLVHMIQGASHSGPRTVQDERILKNLEGNFISQIISAYEQEKMVPAAR